MKALDGWPTIHYTQMGETPTDSPIYHEAQTFQRELPRLLAEGHEGKWALIKGNDIIGLYESFDDGCRLGREKFHFQTFIVQPVREWQPLIRTSEYLRHGNYQLRDWLGRNGFASANRPEQSGQSSADTGRETDPAAGFSQSSD